ncbi:MAG TPA: quinone-dependent dihydroorotate dehydrogenase [Caulobacteraceae bacterium]|jgi:dihydroorotate dehydrogenase
MHDAATAFMRRIDPEIAHGLALAGLKAGWGPVDRTAPDSALATTLAGLALSNPIGLAAGFDKNGEAADAMLRAGFGFVECGTATPLAQPGNPKPRLFRLEADQAVVNRLGFNNRGQEAFAVALARRRRSGIVGANIGANKDSADRTADYVRGLKRLWGLADYFTINISSPNTPGLRDLQAKSALADLLGAISEARRGLTDPARTPIFLKVAPDLSDGEVGDIVDAAVTYDLQGLIVGNTTLQRPPGLRDPRQAETGGLSGAPLMTLSTRILAELHKAASGRLALVGAGGVASGADAYLKIRAGAQAVQLYTGLIYEGPGLVARIRRDLATRLKADGFSSVAEAVGEA